MRFFTQFRLELEQLSSQKLLSFVLLDNYFTDPLTEVQIWYQKTFERESKSQPKYDCF